MVAALGTVLGASSNENLSIVSLNRTEADRDIKVDVEQLAGLLINVDQVVMDRALVKFEIVDPICSLSDALTVITETRSTVDLRDGSLHQVTLVPHQLIAGAIRHGLNSSAESNPTTSPSAYSSRMPATLLQIRSRVAEVVIHLVVIIVTSSVSVPTDTV